MLVANIIGLLRTFIADKSLTLYQTNAELVPFLNQAVEHIYSEIVNAGYYTSVIDSEVTFSSGVQYLDISSLNLFRLLSVRYKDSDVLIDIRSDIEALSSIVPAVFLRREITAAPNYTPTLKLGWHVEPQSSFTILLTYAPEPRLYVTDTDTWEQPNIPKQFHDLIALYAATLILLSDEDNYQAIAERYEMRFESFRQHLIGDHVKSRRVTDVYDAE